MGIDLPFAPALIVLGINRHDNALGAEAPRAFQNQLRIVDGRGVDADLVGSRPQNPLHVLRRRDAAAYRERDGDFPRRPAHNLDHRRPAFH
ncbi:hypothetical protein D3C71_1599440 [compost metagenome]